MFKTQFVRLISSTLAKSTMGVVRQPSSVSTRRSIASSSSSPPKTPSSIPRTFISSSLFRAAVASTLLGGGVTIMMMASSPSDVATSSPSNPSSPSSTPFSLHSPKEQPSDLYTTSWEQIKKFLMSWKSRIKADDAFNDIPLPTDKLACHPQQRQKAPITEKRDAYQPVVLVSCGSFNPPTYMHLRMLELAKQVLTSQGMDVLGAYLSPVNDAYWKKSLIPGIHRVKMCQRAAIDSDFIMVDPWEVEQKQYTRTVHVLQHISRRLSHLFSPPKNNNNNTTTTIVQGGVHASTSGVAVKKPTDEDDDNMTSMPMIRTMLVCGADVVQTMTDPNIWKQDYLETLLSDHGVVCISRDGSGIVTAALLETPGTLLHTYKDKITIVQDPIPNEVSSSLVRHELEQGHSVKYLIPDGVIRYIHENGLYVGEAGIKKMVSLLKNE